MTLGMTIMILRRAGLQVREDDSIHVASIGDGERNHRVMDSRGMISINPVQLDSALVDLGCLSRVNCVVVQQ